jgi:magnesium-transporting ATPase (P-type)
VSVVELVPGDVVVVAPGRVHCDMVLIQSDHVLVDESALTGEATPVVKGEIDRGMDTVKYSVEKHSTITLSAGTDVLEVSEKGFDLALVLKTGSFTAKGKLLADVHSQRRHQFLFADEVSTILLILVVEAVVLLALVFHWLQEQWEYAWFFGKLHIKKAVYVSRSPCIQLSLPIFKQECILSERSFLLCFPQFL